jgi:hypothetical protein
VKIGDFARKRSACFILAERFADDSQAALIIFEPCLEKRDEDFAQFITGAKEVRDVAAPRQFRRSRKT